MKLQLTESELIQVIKTVLKKQNTPIYEDIYGSVESTNFKESNFLN